MIRGRYRECALELAPHQRAAEAGAPEQTGEVERHGVGQRQQAQAVGTRRAVDDHRVPLALLDEVTESDERQELVEDGDGEQLLGLQITDPCLIEELAKIPGDVGPRSRNFRAAVEVHSVQVVGNAADVRAEVDVQDIGHECAASVDTTNVRVPRLAARMAVAAEIVVLPTPPFPVINRIRTSED